jgi:pimeloyl-ACP methyl ester carboxylesterase
VSRIGQIISARERTVIAQHLGDYLSTDVAKDFRSHLKQSSLHVIPAGHWLQVDAPAQVAKEMLS